MESINQFFAWLFGTKAGVLALMVGGVLLFLVLAWVLEKRTRAKFYNHQKSPDDWDLFGDDEE
ncbi:MAG: hypothetical protein IKG18_08625 [Atopobiaceae bacterium]|nr:hypothetical protein [Atopobiaceae bacterium]MBR3314187.1 hypothetical protein [Atopobiaceae bacterium]